MFNLIVRHLRFRVFAKLSFARMRLILADPSAGVTGARATAGLCFG